MKPRVLILVSLLLAGLALADEKEPPSLSLEEPEDFSFSFDSPPTVLNSKAPKKEIPWLGLWLQETDLLEKAVETEGAPEAAHGPDGEGGRERREVQDAEAAAEAAHADHAQRAAGAQ